MRTYYFDKKDGVRVRDHQGRQFATPGEAIDHSRRLANEMRSQHRSGDSDLCIVVIDESGTEVHREPVFPAA